MAPLPHHLHTKLSSDQWELLEQVANARDLTMSGAIRWQLDQVLDEPVNGPGSPTRRELMHEGEIELNGQRYELRSAERAPVA